MRFAGFEYFRSHRHEGVAPAGLRRAHHRGDGQRAPRGCGALRCAWGQRGGGQAAAAQQRPAGLTALRHRHRQQVFLFEGYLSQFQKATGANRKRASDRLTESMTSDTIRKRERHCLTTKWR